MPLAQTPRISNCIFGGTLSSVRALYDECIGNAAEFIFEEVGGNSEGGGKILSVRRILSDRTKDLRRAWRDPGCRIIAGGKQEDLIADEIVAVPDVLLVAGGRCRRTGESHLL